MTHDRFISLLRAPETVTPDDVADLRNIVEAYPYLVSARVLMTKALKKAESIHFSHAAKQTSLYVFDRRWFYFFLHPEQLQAEQKARQSQKMYGNYFDMMQIVEEQGGDTKKSLRELADKLKEARKKTVDTSLRKPVEEVEVSQKEESLPILQTSTQTLDPIKKDASIWDEKEVLAKKFIKEKKYAQAIDILRELNLNNPKKSIYFADQIRFLEKIIENSKN